MVEINGRSSMEKPFDRVVMTHGKWSGSLHPDVADAIRKYFGLETGYLRIVRGSESTEWRVVHKGWRKRSETLGKLDDILKLLASD